MKEILINRRKSIILGIIIMFIVIIITVILQILMWRKYDIYLNWEWVAYFIFIVFIHEGLRAVGFIVLSGAPSSSIKFEFDKKYLAPYCHCEGYENSKSGYIKALLLPNVILSILTLIVLLFTNNLLWNLMFAFVLSGGISDYYMVYLILGYPKDTKFIDHPKKAGFYVVE